MLRDFLDSVKDGNKVDELVVGDLFDEWVMPFSVKVPAQDDQGWFAKVAEVDENADILKALSELTGHAMVRYVHGNHDMQVTAKTLARHAPGVKWDPENPGMGTYHRHRIHAEHGSLYCLFNAPYLLSGDKNKQITIFFVRA